jgi:hypothetical protein
MPPKHAFALWMKKILYFWDLTAQCGWGRLILGHFHDLVLFPGDPTAATFESDSASHEHTRSSFLSDTGRDTNNIGGTGWKGGNDV